VTISRRNFKEFKPVDEYLSFYTVYEMNKPALKILKLDSECIQQEQLHYYRLQWPWIIMRSIHYTAKQDSVGQERTAR
jgi:hypothetical protein